MTDRERINESKCTEFQVQSAFPDNKNTQQNILSCESSTSTVRVTDKMSHQTSLNISSGTSLFCLTSIENKQQLMQARERIKRDKDEGSEAVSTLNQSKKLTAGVCFKQDIV